MKFKSYIFMGVCVWAILYVIVLSHQPFFQELSNRTTDVLIKHRYLNAPKPDNREKIVIVSCDEVSFQKLKARGQINRMDLALFLKKINTPDSRPEIIGFDYAFRGESERARADVIFADALKRSKNVILASYFTPEGKLLLPEDRFLRSVSSAGFVNIPRDSDMIIRRVFAYAFSQDLSLDYSFALQVFSLYNRIPLHQVSLDASRQELVLPATPRSPRVIRVPVTSDTGTTRINYLCAPGDFKVVPFWTALAGLRSGKIFKDKIVLLGSTREIDHDIHPTPFGLMPGVVITANVILSLLNDRLLHETSPWVNGLVLFFAGILACWAVFSLNHLRAGLCVLGLVLAGGIVAVAAIRMDVVFDLSGYVIMVTGVYGLVNVGKYMIVLQEKNHLQQLAMTDALTGLYAFRYFELKLSMEIKAALEEKKKLALAIFDIDNFKKLNDSRGHEAGNEILKKSAKLFTSNVKRSDSVCRYGGEEFVIILPGADLSNAVKVADRVRKAVENAVYPWNGEDIKITISAGVAALKGDGMSAHALIEEADKALYRAKTSGKNRVCSLDT